MECFCICKRKAIVFSGVCCKKLKSIFSVSDGEFREIVRHSHSRPNRHFSSRELLPHSAVYFLRGKISFAGGISPYVEWAKKKIYGGPSTVKALRKQQTNTYKQHTRRTIDVKFSIFLFIWYENCWRWTDHVDLPKHRLSDRTHARKNIAHTIAHIVIACDMPYIRMFACVMMVLLLSVSAGAV